MAHAHRVGPQGQAVLLGGQEEEALRQSVWFWAVVQVRLHVQLCVCVCVWVCALVSVCVCLCGCVYVCGCVMFAPHQTTQQQELLVFASHHSINFPYLQHTTQLQNIA